MTTAPKLEPCPFCGGKHIESVSKTKTGKDIHACMTCGAEAPNWNRRSPSSTPRLLSPRGRGNEFARLDGLAPITD